MENYISKNPTHNIIVSLDKITINRKSEEDVIKLIDAISTIAGHIVGCKLSIGQHHRKEAEVMFKKNVSTLMEVVMILELNNFIHEYNFNESMTKVHDFLDQFDDDEAEKIEDAMYAIVTQIGKHKLSTGQLKKDELDDFISTYMLLLARTITELEQV